MDRRALYFVLLGTLLLAGCGSASDPTPASSTTANSTPTPVPGSGDALRDSAIPVTGFPSGFAVKTDRILEATDPQFDAQPPLKAALDGNGFIVGYLRYGELPQQGGLTPSGVVELYRFPSDDGAGKFATALGSTFTTGGATSAVTTVIPGGIEYTLRTAGSIQSITVVGVRHGVAFQVTLGGAANMAATIEQLAKLQYDRL